MSTKWKMSTKWNATPPSNQMTQFLEGPIPAFNKEESWVPIVQINNKFSFWAELLKGAQE